MITKKTLFLILIFSLTQKLFSQGVDYKYEAKYVAAIKQTTIYVIPTKDEAFNDSVNHYMKKFWKVTPYKIISREEADVLLKEQTNYFLGSVNVLGNNGGQNSTVISPKDDFSSYVFVFHGSKKSKLKNIEYQDALFCRLPFYGVENYQFGVGYMVKSLNDNIELLIKLQNSGKLTETNSPSKPWIPALRTEFSKRAKVLKEKTLLIPVEKTQRYGNLSEKVMGSYKYPYKIVSTADLLNLLKTDPKKYCFLAANEDMDIYDAETNEVVFSAETETGSGTNKITEKHIQSLNKFIGQP